MKSEPRYFAPSIYNNSLLWHGLKPPSSAALRVAGRAFIARLAGMPPAELQIPEQAPPLGPFGFPDLVILLQESRGKKFDTAAFLRAREIREQYALSILLPAVLDYAEAKRLARRAVDTAVRRQILLEMAGDGLDAMIHDSLNDSLGFAVEWQVAKGLRGDRREMMRLGAILAGEIWKPSNLAAILATAMALEETKRLSAEEASRFLPPPRQESPLSGWPYLHARPKESPWFKSWHYPFSQVRRELDELTRKAK